VTVGTCTDASLSTTLANMPETDNRGPTPIKVMIAESNPHLAAVLSWVLSHDDRFQVVAKVHEGAAALACELPFDLALVDLGIFGLGGLGTVAQLHARQPTPLIAVLADSDAIYLRHAAEAEGADAYFVKPAHLSDLEDRLAALFAARTRQSHRQ
jgi:DNA-binding NarL/FixJ family response regulator